MIKNRFNEHLDVLLAVSITNYVKALNSIKLDSTIKHIPKSIFRKKIKNKKMKVQSFCHTYSFNRRQRMERDLTLKTGLDRKSRLLKLSCKNLKIKLQKCSRCPYCHYAFTNHHSCKKIVSKKYFKKLK